MWDLDEDSFITLTDENGNEVDFLLLDVMEYEGHVVAEQFIDKNGRTILWRRFNRDDWANDSFGGGRWSQRLPENDRITVNGETYVHWYDCISNYVM